MSPLSERVLFNCSHQFIDGAAGTRSWALPTLPTETSALDSRSASPSFAEAVFARLLSCAEQSMCRRRWALHSLPCLHGAWRKLWFCWKYDSLGRFSWSPTFPLLTDVLGFMDQLSNRANSKDSRFTLAVYDLKNTHTHSLSLEEQDPYFKLPCTLVQLWDKNQGYIWYKCCHLYLWVVK